MLGSVKRPLLMGEIFVDFTLTDQGKENKLRLGGVTHAARGCGLKVDSSMPL